MVELKFGHKIKTLQTDCAKEFLALRPFLESYGIFLCHSLPYTHQQNGVLERKYRHLIDTILALLSQASLPLKFWGETV